MAASPFSVPDAALPTWLAGEWAIERDFGGARGTFAGTATFAEEAPGVVRWSEHGSLTLDGHTGTARRTLFLHAAEPWEVRFDDDRPFHALDLSRGACAVEHVCGPDLYLGTYDPLGADELVVRWTVTGPGRNDTILSRYRRVGRATRGIRTVSGAADTGRPALP